MIYSIISFLPRLGITLKPSRVSINSFNIPINDTNSAVDDRCVGQSTDVGQP